jgi:hypothetical protein
MPFRPLAGAGDVARLAAAQLEDQPGADFDAPIGGFGIDTALEAITCIGIDAELAPGARGDHGIEQRRFQEHVAGLRDSL